jgi:phenylalanine-4-hydroxylase
LGCRLEHPHTGQGVRAYAAGILSSGGELRHSVRSAEPRRVAFELKRLMRTRYKIDPFQGTYFVIDAFQQLFDATAPDFAPVYAEVRAWPQIEAGTVLSGEREFSPG